MISIKVVDVLVVLITKDKCNKIGMNQKMNSEQAKVKEVALRVLED
jgi:hypothetical protein